LSKSNRAFKSEKRRKELKRLQKKKEKLAKKLEKSDPGESKDNLSPGEQSETE
jgi:hypothetical protein